MTAARKLIVTADDVGLHPGMTEGAIRAHRQGIVTACSIVANGAAFDDAVEHLKDVPDLEAGVHLTLVEEKPLTAMHFPKKYTTFAPLFALRAIPMAAIERELRAQIERVLAAGIRVTHLNGHQHLHLLPRLFALVARLAKEYEVPYVRIVDDRGGGDRAMSMRALSFLGRRARARFMREQRAHSHTVNTLFVNDHTVGVANAGHLANVKPLLDHVQDVTELVTHPGVGVDGYAWGYAWDEETRALCAPGLREEIARRGIELTSPSRVTAIL